MSIYLAEVAYYDIAGASAGTLYYGTHAFVTEPGDTPANTYFDERIKQPALLSRHMFGRGRVGGGTRRSRGQLVLYNDDGELDDLIGYAFDGREVTIWWAESRDSSFPGDFEEVMVATMAGPPEFLRGEVRFQLRDRQELVDVPIQTTLYAGDNALPAGLEGVEDLKGKPKPVCLGKVRNVPAVLVNSAKLIYQVNDGAVDSIDMVYDRGIPILSLFQSASRTNGFGTNNVEEVVYADDLFVAVGHLGNIETSPDGETWTSRTTPVSVDLEDVHHHDGLFVAVGENGTIITSPDGATWTSRTSNFGSGTQDIEGVTYGGGVWVVVGVEGNVCTSPDGVTWTAQSSLGSATNVLHGVAYGNGLHVAVGGDDGGSGTVWVSSDGGVNWTQLSDTTGDTLLEVTFNGSVFVAVGQQGRILSSIDGEVWDERDGGAFSASQAESVTWGGGRFLIGGDQKIAVSYDGLNWEGFDFPLPGTANILGSAYGGPERGGRVLVGTGGNVFSLEIGGADYASESELLDDEETPAAGGFRAYPDGGYFRLGSPPAGQVTADVTQGATASDRTAGQLFTAVLQRAGLSSGDWSGSDITTLDSSKNHVLGLWTGLQEKTCIEALDEIARSVLAWWGIDRKGLFRIQEFTDPDGQATELTLTDDDILGWPERIRSKGGDHGVPIYRSVVRYQKNHQVQNDVAAGVSDARRGVLSKEWQEETDEDASIQTAHPLAKEESTETLLDESADASSEATDRLTLFGEQRDTMEVVVPVTAETVQRDLGSIVELQSSRYGLSAGDEFLVIGVEPDGARKRIRWEMWR